MATKLKLPRKGATRRRVADEEMAAALKNTDNQNIMHNVLERYSGMMHPSDLKNCGLHALWKTLQYHKEEFGQKFTTSLFRFLHWEVRRELKRQRNEKKGMLPLSSVGDIPSQEKEDGADHREGLSHLRDCMQFMSEEQKQFLHEFYLDQWTLDEIASIHSMSKEAARQKIAIAVARLKELCEESDKPVYSEPE